MRTRRWRVAGWIGGGLCVAVALLAGCRSAGHRVAPPAPDTVDAGEGNRAYYAGTPAMRGALDGLIAHLPDTEGEARMALGRRIVAYGEPAIPALVRALDSPDAEARGAAAWLLGFLHDPRSADPLGRHLQDAAPLVRYEAAASLLKLGDDRGTATIVAGLEDPDPLIRAKCIILLEEVTGRDLGYRPDLAPDERAAAVARWRAWAASRAGAHE